MMPATATPHPSKPSTPARAQAAQAAGRCLSQVSGSLIPHRDGGIAPGKEWAMKSTPGLRPVPAQGDDEACPARVGPCIVHPRYESWRSVIISSKPGILHAFYGNVPIAALTCRRQMGRSFLRLCPGIARSHHRTLDCEFRHAPAITPSGCRYERERPRSVDGSIRRFCSAPPSTGRFGSLQAAKALRAFVTPAPTSRDRSPINE